MKIFNRSIFASALTVVLLAGCSDDPNPSSDDNIKPIAIPATVSAAANDFAFNFFDQIRETQPQEDNLFVSPLSLNMALGMLLNGAEDVSASEIKKALGAENISVEELNAVYKTLIESLPAVDPKVKLGLANSMWYKSGVVVENSFQDVLKKSFHSDVTGLPFDNAAKDKINKWASDKTEGKIQKVLDKIEPDHILFLLNALYFKGSWKTTFDNKLTTDNQFTLEDQSVKTVKMMNVKSKFKIASPENYKAVQLPYGNGQFNMTILIPKGQNTIDKVLNEVDATNWKTLSNNLSDADVNVGVPRFSLDYSVQLKETLKTMGINKVFEVGADLQKITKSPNLFVDFVKQDTYLSIDEQGTEAAAVTSIGVGVTSAGPDNNFICNRPFGFIISETTSNTILFMGRIKNPDSK